MFTPETLVEDASERLMPSLGERKEGDPVSHDDEVFPDTEEGDR